MTTAEPRTPDRETDRWLLVASVVVGGLTVFAPLTFIGAVGLLVSLSVRLARQWPQSAAVLTTSIIVLSVSLVVALAMGIAIVGVGGSA